MKITLGSATVNNSTIWKVNVKIPSGSFTFFLCEDEWRAKILAAWLQRQNLDLIRSFYSNHSWSHRHPMAEARELVKKMACEMPLDKAVEAIDEYLQREKVA